MVRTSEVDAKPAPPSLGLSKIKVGNHGNQVIGVCQLTNHTVQTRVSYFDVLFNHSNNVDYVSLKTKVCILQLKNVMMQNC
jgi:hypothetical protein